MRAQKTAPSEEGPLGILPDRNVPHDVLTKLKKIEAFDFSRERIEIEASKIVPKVESLLLIRDLKRFLSLSVLEPAGTYTFVPSQIVDAAWHAFILDTPRYLKFCNEIVGTFIHHAPEDTRANGLAKYAGENFRRTKALLTKYYGGLAPTIWGRGADCDKPAPCRHDWE